MTKLLTLLQETPDHVLEEREIDGKPALLRGKLSDILIGINIKGCQAGAYSANEISRVNQSTWDAQKFTAIPVDTTLNHEGVQIPKGSPCVAILFECARVVFGRGERVQVSGTLVCTAVYTRAGTFLGFTAGSVYTNDLLAFCRDLFLTEKE